MNLHRKSLRASESTHTKEKSKIIESNEPTPQGGVVGAGEGGGWGGDRGGITCCIWHSTFVRAFRPFFSAAPFLNKVYG